MSRVAFLNWSDQIGGAARSANRLLQAINRGSDFRADFLVGHATYPESVQVLPNTTSVRGRMRARLDRLPLLLYPQRTAAPWSVNWLPDTTQIRRALQRYSLVHLHWVGSGVMSPNVIGGLTSPAIWTLHDLWPASGGCHINYNCARLALGCGACPALGSAGAHDLSQQGVRRKRDAYKNARVTFVAPSKWMAEHARTAPALEGCEVLVIRNGIDVKTFKPHDKPAARVQLGIEPEAFAILFGAVNGTADPNKGYDLLQQALSHAKPRLQGRKPQLIVFGSHKTGFDETGPLRAVHFGHIADENRLAALYSACDVTVVPSRMESFGQVALESIACGTPVVCFGGSGLSEIVGHKVTGYVARPFDPEDLANGIWWWSKRLADQMTTSIACVKEARTHYDIDSVAAEYSSVYARLLKRP